MNSFLAFLPLFALGEKKAVGVLKGPTSRFRLDAHLMPPLKLLADPGVLHGRNCQGTAMAIEAALQGDHMSLALALEQHPTQVIAPTRRHRSGRNVAPATRSVLHGTALSVPELALS